MQANEIAQLRIGKSLLARHFIKRKPHRHGATVAHLIARIAQQFLQQPRPVLQRAAIFVAALIGPPRQEMLQNAKAMRAIEAHDIIARPLGAAVSQLVPVAQVPDILLVHGARLHRIAGERQDGAVHRPHRHFARVKIGTIGSAIGQLNAGQRPVGMNGIGHLR